MPQKQIVIQLTAEQAEKLKQNVKGLQHVKHEGEHHGHFNHPENGDRMFNFSFDAASGKLTLTPINLPIDVPFDQVEARIREDVAVLTA